MKILLTGPKGNLGQALQRAGSQHQWTLVGREQWDRLTNSSADVVIHAASDLLTPVWKDPEALFDSNIMSTVKLLREFPKDARLVFVSSCAVYGRSEITREETDPAPISVNGISKYLCEATIQEFCTKHKIEYQIFRVFNTFGGTDRFSIISHLQRSLREKRPFTLFNHGISQRDYIHVDDVAELVLRMIEQPIKHRIMNIGSGEATRVKDIVTEFRKKHPALEIVAAERPEAEYSRADISRLREVVPDFEFRNVLDFI